MLKKDENDSVKKVFSIELDLRETVRKHDIIFTENQKGPKATDTVHTYRKNSNS